MIHTVKMLKTVHGYDDVRGPRALSLYEQGKTYEVSDAFLKDLIEDGAVEIVDAGAKRVEDRETKVVEDMETKPKKKGKAA